jgi:AAHS family 4-hydroxybenzoate transporter-like MFS transporter
VINSDIQETGELVYGVRTNRFLVGVWMLCFLVLFLDGYDMTVIAFVAPHLVEELAFDKTHLGFLFSAGLLGMMIGGALGGWMGDRRGRRFTIVSGCLLFGIATLAMLHAVTLVQMAVCRVIIGIGMGAALATAVALAAEFAPTKLRGRVIALVGMATPFGSIMPALLTASVVPTLGWRVLLIIGGVLPVLLAIVIARKLPESIEYLAPRPGRQGELMAILRRIDPAREWTSALAAGAATRGAPKPLSLARLFAQGLAPITLLVWALLFTSSMALYLINNWMPIVLQNVGLSTRQVGVVSSLFFTGGLIGILGVAAWFSRAGISLLPAMFVIAVPFLLSTMAFDSPETTFIVCVLVPGVALGAILALCNMVSGLVYPTDVRATGIGLALAAGRLGAVAGPLVGTAVLALDLPAQRIFAASAIPMVVGAVAAIALTLLCRRRFGGFQLRDTRGALHQATLRVHETH